MIDMESLVREAMTEHADHLHLGHDAADRAIRAAGRRHTRRRRVVLIAAVGAGFTLVGAGVAAGTGVLPWWNRAQTTSSAMTSPFATATDPAAVPGSTVRLTVRGPESTTFEVITDTVTVGTGQADCTAIAVEDAEGRSQRLTTSCAAAGAAVAQAASLDWQAPSGATYVVVAGPSPTSSTATVALLDGNGVEQTTEPTGGGYYLLYAPAGLSSGRLVFHDAHGRLVAELALPRRP